MEVRTRGDASAACLVFFFVSRFSTLAFARSLHVPLGFFTMHVGEMQCTLYNGNYPRSSSTLLIDQNKINKIDGSTESHGDIQNRRFFTIIYVVVTLFVNPFKILRASARSTLRLKLCILSKKVTKTIFMEKRKTRPCDDEAKARSSDSYSAARQISPPPVNIYTHHRMSRKKLTAVNSEKKKKKR